MSDEPVEPNAKVLFRVDREDESADVETLWAFDLGDDVYRLDNSPFFAYSVSWKDEVYAPFDMVEGFPVFQRVHTKSGNRTIRLILDPPFHPGNSTDTLLQRLLEMDCSYESATRSLFAVTVPPESDFSGVVDLLIEQGVQWEYADPSYDEIYPDEDLGA